ncbi:MAG TPA: VWA domain-containing protein [Candidatus Acidoferrales bacterium]|nr:VWA domain-containing protein [Candidatus Acidoferrales bacterium]
MCALPAALLAQAGAGPLPPAQGTTIQKAPQNGPSTIRVPVRLVAAPAVVRDNKGELVVDLLQGDFKVFDNGVEQKVDHFDVGGDPVSAVLVVETSSRIAPILPAITKAGIVFTQSVLGANGIGAVIGFDSQIVVASQFSGDADTIEKAVGKLPPGDSGARLYDSMATAVNMLRDQPVERRRVILAITEASDRGSDAKLGDVLRDAQLANVTIFSVGLSTTAAQLRQPTSNKPNTPSPTPPGVYGDPPMPGTPQTPTSEAQRTEGGDLMAVAVWAVTHGAQTVKANALAVAATATGGDHIATKKDSGIEEALDRIGGELHAQYTLSYQPTGVAPAGYHEIKIQVARGGLHVQSRPGYYQPPAVGGGE